jgi:hypothetical protein
MELLAGPNSAPRVWEVVLHFRLANAQTNKAFKHFKCIQEDNIYYVRVINSFHGNPLVVTKVLVRSSNRSDVCFIMCSYSLFVCTCNHLMQLHD